MRSVLVGLFLFVAMSCAARPRTDAVGPRLTDASVSDTYGVLANARRDLAVIRNEHRRHSSSELEVKEMETVNRILYLRAFTTRMSSALDAGTLNAIVRDGNVVLQVPAAVLFEGGRSELASGGQHVLFEIAETIRSVGGEQFGKRDPPRVYETPPTPASETRALREIRVYGQLVERGVSREAITAKERKNPDRIEITIHPEAVALGRENDE